ESVERPRPPERVLGCQDGGDVDGGLRCRGERDAGERERGALGRPTERGGRLLPQRRERGAGGSERGELDGGPLEVGRLAARGEEEREVDRRRSDGEAAGEVAL